MMKTLRIADVTGLPVLPARNLRNCFVSPVLAGLATAAVMR
jgi:hypothetical protein